MAAELVQRQVALIVACATPAASAAKAATVSMRSALGERTMLETPILIVIVVLVIAAVVWWLYR
jgi:high-affinity Fe2+/Pb2+ permease